MNHIIDKWCSPYPYAPWCWYIYLHDWVIVRVNVGKYSSTMEHMGLVISWENPLENDPLVIYNGKIYYKITRWVNSEC